MSSEYLSPLANHLWQSTLVAGMAALSAWILRSNSARIRYWVWLFAAMKFLIPFALLVGIGHRFEWRKPPGAARGSLSTVAQISMPFDALPLVSISPSADSTVARNSLFNGILFSVWLSGVVVSVWFWLRSWWRVHRARLTAIPMPLDLPINDIRIRILSSPTLLEPSVFGIFRPVLLVRNDISNRMTADQLKALMAHELCHIRRRDNLKMGIYMIAETLFWFYPLVHWIGRRLIDERERACDEEVLLLGNDPVTYAEGIVRVCKDYLESPLRCASGVTGSDLKRRLRAILDGGVVSNLSIVKKAALATAVAGVLTLPIAIGVLNAQAARPPVVPDWQRAAGGRMAFEVASIKQGPFEPSNFPLDAGNSFVRTGGYFKANFPAFVFIGFAYKLNPPGPEQKKIMLDSVPDWVISTRFTIEARAPGNPTKDQFRLMMQTLLAERFRLAVHYETHEIPVYALSLVSAGKLGPKLHRHTENPPCNPGEFEATQNPCGNVFMGRVSGSGHRILQSRNIPMALFADYLFTISSGAVGRLVLDRTRLSGGFDLTLDFLPEDQLQSDPQGPAFIDALHEQLGLQLEPTKAPVQILRIDHVELPSEN
jgi:bla regulator protein blaR1